MRKYIYTGYIIYSKIIRKLEVFVSKTCTYWLFFLNGVEFKTFKSYGVPFIKIALSGKLIIDENVTLISGKNFNVIGGDTRLNIVVGENAILQIGKNVGISNGTICCRKAIIIEENVLIGGSCKIYDTDFHSKDLINRLNPYINNKPDSDIKCRTVILKKGVWIGGHSIILKGVTIGQNSIIGAGSVVSRDIPENEIWAGNPIKFVAKL
jgi:acetyltransferase-like isoleucine patch superfamily enzyme